MSANEYARQRGREAPDSPVEQPARTKAIPLVPLTSADQARIASNRALVHEHLPEALPFIKELHELGMIPGWRAVEAVEVFPNSEPEGQP